MPGTDESAAASGRPPLSAGIATPVARLVRPGLGSVPIGAPVGGITATDGTAVQAFIERHQRLLVLTGAGISTTAGIPDYRDAEGRWKGAAPMSWQAFSSSAAARRRYWARSLVGWARMAGARPTAAHRALAQLEAQGRSRLLVTQNVDGLHERAGSRAVVDLHGRLDRVICLDCGQFEDRAAFQQRLLASNPTWPWLPELVPGTTADPNDAPRPRVPVTGTGTAGSVTLSQAVTSHQAAAVTQSIASDRPDGDADLDAIDGIDYEAFVVPTCTFCDGVLKPDVVFFGDSVPRDRIALANAALDEADAVLIVGSSLTVFSGWRYARDAAARGLPLAAINLGATRADPLLALKVIASADDALAFLLNPAS